MNHMCEISPRAYRGRKLGVICTLANTCTSPFQGTGLRFAMTELAGVTNPSPLHPPPTCHKTIPWGGTIIHRGPSLTQMLEAYGWSITQLTQMHTNSTYTFRRIYIKRTPCFRSFCLSETQHY